MSLEKVHRINHSTHEIFEGGRTVPPNLRFLQLPAIQDQGTLISIQGSIENLQVLDYLLVSEPGEGAFTREDLNVLSGKRRTKS
jgi:hypothetical protein